MLSKLQRATTQPASFFETEPDEPSVVQPALVVAAVAVIGLVSTIPTFIAVLQATPADASPFVAVSLALGSLVGVIGPFISWAIVVVLFLLGTAIFGGDGEFRDLFALVGWGFAPRALVPIVGGIVSFLILSGTNFTDPQQARQLSQMATTGPLGILNLTVNAATFLWAGWVWTHAVAAARNVSVRDARIVVGVVILLELVVNVGLSLLSLALV